MQKPYRARRALSRKRARDPRFYLVIVLWRSSFFFLDFYFETVNGAHYDRRLSQVLRPRRFFFSQLSGFLCARGPLIGKLAGPAFSLPCREKGRRAADRPKKSKSKVKGGVGRSRTLSRVSENKDLTIIANGGLRDRTATSDLTTVLLTPYLRT